jgi:hypothetical protein
MADYHLEEYGIELWVGKIAREVADEFTAKKPDKPRFSGFDRSQIEQQACHQM